MGKEFCSTTTILCRDDGSEIYDVTAEGYIHYYTEKRYGEDADGNRGISQTFVEDVTEVCCYDVTGEEIELSEAEAGQLGDDLIDKFFL